MALPTYAARDAIDRGLGEVTRRVEIYESDGQTLWTPAGGQRLMDGSISVSYGDNERRAIDLTLENTDNLLRSSPNGFWYDKVIKPYRGVKWSANTIIPRGVVIDFDSAGLVEGTNTAAWLKRFGIDCVAVPLTTTGVDFFQYDFIISAPGAGSNPTSAALLKALYEAGKAIITIGTNTTAAEVPHIVSTTAMSSTWGISQPTVSNEFTPGWTSEANSGTYAGAAVTAIAPGAIQVARWQQTNGSYGIAASVAFNKTGGRWFDLHLSGATTGTALGVQFSIMVNNVMRWMKSAASATSWETQVGEFVIDGINDDYFPSAVKVTGRDYVKRGNNSKIEQAVTFGAGTSINQIVSALAANAGILKQRLAAMPEVLASELSFDRGVPRWEIMRQAAAAFKYEIFFDAEGYLQTRPFRDPTTTPPLYTFQTGQQGNLSKLSRATNDSRIYNHIVVYGDPPSGEQRMPYVGEAKNVEATSPTRIAKLGDRYYSYASTFFNNQLQCKQFADSMLKVHALESYEMSFDSINYPWLEVGEIAKVLDQKATSSDPTTYLVDSATIPLGLGPMSSTGKRVTIVG